MLRCLIRARHNRLSKLETCMCIDKRRRSKRRRVTNAEEKVEARPGSLLVIFLTVFIDLLGFGLVLPLLPIYADQFSLDKSGVMLGLLMASFSVMQFIFAPILGRTFRSCWSSPGVNAGTCQFCRLLCSVRLGDDDGSTPARAVLDIRFADRSGNRGSNTANRTSVYR